MKALILSICLVVAGLAMAEAKAPQGPGPCGEDVKKFCGNVQKGRGAIFECMKKNEAQISAGCKEHMAKMGERMKSMSEGFRAAREACRGDVEKFCKEAPTGHGGKIHCLMDNQEKPDFSAGCREQMAKIKMMEHEGPGIAGPPAPAVTPPKKSPAPPVLSPSPTPGKAPASVAPDAEKSELED